MFHLIYTAPIPLLFSILMLSLCVWALITYKVMNASLKAHLIWRITNGCLSIFCIFVVYYLAIANRTETVHEMYLYPFRLLIGARHNPELYRSMFMNVIFFLPFGMAFSSTFSKNVTVKQRIVFTCIVGLFLSFSVEVLQYCTAIGIAEFDDLICNTFGAFLGTLHLPIINIFKDTNTK